MSPPSSDDDPAVIYARQAVEQVFDSEAATAEQVPLALSRINLQLSMYQAGSVLRFVGVSTA